jgi:16S rRNA processing protein RimM
VERARELANVDVFFPVSVMQEYNRNAGADEKALSYPMLIGFKVNDIGKIAYIDNQTANIMFELEDGTLIPASEELITDIDKDNKTITIALPEGILDL